MKFTTVRIPELVRDQLADLALFMGRSMSEVVTDMVQQRTDETDWRTRAIPGVLITPNTVDGVPLVTFSLEGSKLTALERHEVSTLADEIDKTARAGSRFDLASTTRGSRRIQVFRRGRGVVVAINETEHSFSAPIAHQLAATLRRTYVTAAGLPEAEPPVGPPTGPIELTDRVREVIETFGLKLPTEGSEA
jgi:hypothetical protein